MYNSDKWQQLLFSLHLILLITITLLVTSSWNQPQSHSWSYRHFTLFSSSPFNWPTLSNKMSRKILINHFHRWSLPAFHASNITNYLVSMKKTHLISLMASMPRNKCYPSIMRSVTMQDSLKFLSRTWVLTSVSKTFNFISNHGNDLINRGLQPKMRNNSIRNDWTATNQNQLGQKPVYY